MNADMITITREEYDELTKAADKLDALESMGVDNWDGYDDAMDKYRANRSARLADDAAGEVGNG